MWGTDLRISRPVKRKVFVSYHHGGDQAYYDAFSRVFHDLYDVIYDNSLERAINSSDTTYTMRRIRENFITGSSCTLVLCGLNTYQRKYVDWEIAATLDKGHGLIGVKLPTLPVINDGCQKPDRLQDNLDSGYAVWVWWEVLMQNPAGLAGLIEQANERPRSLIRNGRAYKLRNG